MGSVCSEDDMSGRARRWRVVQRRRRSALRGAIGARRRRRSTRFGSICAGDASAVSSFGASTSSSATSPISIVPTRLVVELDGASHEARYEYDRERSQIFACFGIEVVRFTNADVLSELPSVLDRLASACRARFVVSMKPCPAALGSRSLPPEIGGK